MPEFVVPNAQEFGWKFRPDPDRFSSVYNRLKLLKLQTLRIDDDCKEYSTKRGGFGGLVKRRIEGVTQGSDGLM
jgi:hypothetical protein